MFCVCCRLSLHVTASRNLDYCRVPHMLLPYVTALVSGGENATPAPTPSRARQTKRSSCWCWAQRTPVERMWVTATHAWRTVETWAPDSRHRVPPAHPPHPLLLQPSQRRPVWKKYRTRAKARSKRGKRCAEADEGAEVAGHLKP